MFGFFGRIFMKSVLRDNGRNDHYPREHFNPDYNHFYGNEGGEDLERFAQRHLNPQERRLHYLIKKDD